MKKNWLTYGLLALGLYLLTRKEETSEETSGNETKDTATKGSDVVVAAPSGPVTTTSKPTTTTNKPNTPSSTSPSGPVVASL